MDRTATIYSIRGNNMTVPTSASIVHNYPAYVFRMTSLLEKLGIKNATYVHKDDVKALCRKMKVW